MLTRRRVEVTRFFVDLLDNLQYKTGTLWEVGGCSDDCASQEQAVKDAQYAIVSYIDAHIAALKKVKRMVLNANPPHTWLGPSRKPKKQSTS